MVTDFRSRDVAAGGARRTTGASVRKSVLQPDNIPLILNDQWAVSPISAYCQGAMRAATLALPWWV
jgi:hypothetical protein